MGDLANAMIPLGCVLALGVAASYIRQRLMVSVGQGTMLKIRTDLFTHMESLPIRYFDTHSHGDIMSIYTNDFKILAQRPLDVFIGACAQFIIMPGVAYTLVHVWHLDPVLALGILLVGCCPGGVSSNIMSYLCLSLIICKNKQF